MPEKSSDFRFEICFESTLLELHAWHCLGAPVQLLLCAAIGFLAQVFARDETDSAILCTLAVNHELCLFLVCLLAVFCAFFEINLIAGAANSRLQTNGEPTHNPRTAAANTWQHLEHHLSCRS